MLQSYSLQIILARGWGWGGVVARTAGCRPTYSTCLVCVYIYSLGGGGDSTRNGAKNSLSEPPSFKSFTQPATQPNSLAPTCVYQRISVSDPDHVTTDSHPTFHFEPASDPIV